MKSKFKRNILIYTLGEFLKKSIGLILIPIYTRYYTETEYGILAILNVLLQLTTFMALLGVGSAAMRYYFDTGEGIDAQNVYYGNAGILLIIWPFLFIGLMGIFLKNYAPLLLPGIEYDRYIFFMLLVGLFTPLHALVGGLLRVKELAGQYIVYNVTFFAVQAIAIIFAVTQLHGGLHGQLVAQSIVGLLYWFVSLAILRKYSKLTLSANVLKKLLKYGLPLIPGFILLWFYSASGRIILARFYDLSAAGLFALALQFAGLLVILGRSFSVAATPQFFKLASKEDAERRLGQFATKYFSTFFILSLVVLTAFKPIFLLVVGQKFHSASQYVPPLLIVTTLEMAYYFFEWGLLYSKKTKDISYILAIALCCMFVSLYITNVILGLTVFGVIFAMQCMNIVRIAMAYKVSSRYINIVYEKKKLGVSIWTYLVGYTLITICVYSLDALSGSLLSIPILVICSLIILKTSGIRLSLT